MKDTIMKKEYMNPTMKVVEVKHRCHILAGSTDPHGMENKLQNEEVDYGW